MTPSSSPTVLIADDNLVMRAGLAHQLQRAAELSVVESGSAAEAVKAAGEAHPDAVLVDARVIRNGEPGTVRELAAAAPVVVLAFSGDAAVASDCVAQGALASLRYGEFTPPELAEVVTALARPEGPPATAEEIAGLVGRAGPATAAALRTESGLTEREAQVLRMVAGGMSNAMIADHLVVSEKTVKNHINHIYAKLHVRNRAEAVELWRSASSALV
ncbi:response regulator transcription factor [Nocardiopsis coralliicola]